MNLNHWSVPDIIHTLVRYAAFMSLVNLKKKKNVFAALGSQLLL